MTQHFAFLDFAAIQNEEQLKNYSETVAMTFYQQLMSDEKGLKNLVAELLRKIHTQITNVSASPRSKFMSLLMLKELSEKHSLNRKKEDKNSKLFSLLSSHQILNEMRNIAENVDPFKKVTDKGLNYFPSSSGIGNDYIRLNLELIRFWASRFPATNKSQPTKYKKILDELAAKKVIFPNQYKFLTFANKKPADESDTGRYRSGQQEQTGAFASQTPQPPQTGRSTVKAEIYHMYNRLLNFVESLDDEASAVQPEIRNIHSQIKNQIKKYESMEEEVYEMIDKDSETSRKYFAVVEFMHKELQYHEQYISSSNMDFPSYVLAIKLEAQKNFQELNGGEPAPQVQPRKSEPNHPQNSNSRYKEQSTPPPPPASKPDSKKVSMDPKTINSVTSYFEKLEERSKSPIAGFKKISQSLSREKASVIKRSVSPISKSKNSFTKSMASLKQSKVSPIFANPPNLNPPYKNYQGREIQPNDHIKSALRSITKSQGLRRFKTANFKGKSSLFQNQHIQIGFKTQAVYEQVSNFKVIIKVQLYFGNLGDERIHDLALQFKGDQSNKIIDIDVLLYANPRTIQSTIARGDQNKIDLMIVPVKVPFPMLVMTMRYSILGDMSEHKIIIPNSVLKLAHFMNISKEEFGSRWTASEVLKVPSQKLCHYLPPDTFLKWIPQLGQLSSYTAFASPGSKKDYQLYCVIILMQRYESLLKINIRPNLEFVLQLGIQDKNQESTQYFTYLLQTLHQLLQQVS